MAHQAAANFKTHEHSAPLHLRQPLAQLLPAVQVSVSFFAIPFSVSLSLSVSLLFSLSLSIFLCVFIRSRAAGCTCSWRKHRNLPLPSFDTRVTGSQYKRTAVGLGVHLSQEPIKGARNKPTKRSYDCNVSHANGMMTAAAWNSSSGTACKSTTFGSRCRRGHRDLGRRELLGSKVGNRQH